MLTRSQFRRENTFDPYCDCFGQCWGKHHKGAAKKQADTGVGLGGTALDYAKIQEVLFARPTGKDDRGSYVHQLIDPLMIGDQSVMTTNMILNQINS